MEVAILYWEFGLFVLILFVISFQLWRLKVNQETVLSKLAALKASVETLINRPAQAQADLQAVGDAVDAIQAEVDAKNAQPAS